MNDSFSSTLFMGLMFVLRCLVPLGILFGISYLLKRMELVVNDDQAKEPAPVEEEEDAEQAEDESAEGDPESAAEPEPAPKKPAPRKPAPAKKKTTGAKKKSAASKKES